jgi:ABC-type Fe3+ transport system permease subunit
VFHTIIIPLTLPGVVAGGLLVFAAAVTAFITQTLVGSGRIILMPYYIYQLAVGVQAATGVGLVGFLSRGSQSASTRHLIAELGFLYDCNALNDDLPY